MAHRKSPLPAPEGKRIEPDVEARTLAESMEEAVSEGERCAVEPSTDPVAIVIFGATGDLASRKIFPALHSLCLSGAMRGAFVIVGASRSELSHEEFRATMKESLADGGEPERWAELEERVYYQRVDFQDAETFRGLAELLAELDERHGTQGNRIHYLAVPPAAYKPIASNLGRAGMSRERQEGNGKVRIVVEKPFGRDLETARDLDRTLHESFEEHQIFRIDHYMAKETVQNVLMLRFANAIFEPIWNRGYIDHVQITAAESIGVEHRAGYYDEAGVLRDMFQNHMMMLLSLCAMEPPSVFQAERVRDEKIKVFRALKPFPVDRLDDHLVLGQYASGTVGGEKVRGYVDESGVAADSLTPTYAMMKVYIDNWRWQGVPFHIASGKRLKEKRTEIAVQFKEVPCSMFRHILGDHITANRLILGIQPDEHIDLTFQTKTPGSKVCLRSVTMHFDYGQGSEGPTLDAYEKVLLDVMIGDQTLFWRQDAVEICWGFLTPILEECDCPERADRLLLYKSGSWGPQQAKRLFARG